MRREMSQAGVLGGADDVLDAGVYDMTGSGPSGQYLSGIATYPRVLF